MRRIQTFLNPFIKQLFFLLFPLLEEIENAMESLSIVKYASTVGFLVKLRNQPMARWIV
jgi:hypothetical protein